MAPPPADDPADRTLGLLSPREKDCLRLVFDNHSSKEIARRLGISQTSVETHVRSPSLARALRTWVSTEVCNARAKLGERDRYAAARRLHAHEEAAAAPPPPAAEPAPTQEPPAARPRRLLPPLEELSFADRLLLVVGCAIVAALIFGLLLPAFAAL